MVERDNVVLGKLVISATGRTRHTRNRVRSKLLAKMITQVLNHDGYHIGRILNTDSVQMELDIQGFHKKTGYPFYAACRFSGTLMSKRDLQAFYGRYMIHWHSDRRCYGLFMVLPGLDDMAGNFYRDHIENNKHTTTYLYDEEAVLKVISEIPGHVRRDRIADRLSPDLGQHDQGALLCTEKGLFWIWTINSHEGKTPVNIAVFDVNGGLVSDLSIINYIKKLYPQVVNIDNISANRIGSLQPGLFQDADPVVALHGSSSWFEYKFPASSQHFVGRESLLKQLDLFAHQVIRSQTTHRGLVFEAPPGWGKSSVILASISRLKKAGHIAVAVDCRTASSSTFVPRVIEYALGNLEGIEGRMNKTDQKKPAAEFNDAVRWFLDIGSSLKFRNKLLFIFFDQFENIFFLPDVLNQIISLFLGIVENQTNIILGFSWDKNSILSSPAFSEKRFDAVADECRKMIPTTFSKTEIKTFFNQLGKKLDEPLSKSLLSFIEKFSQGFPWLVKMLCFHGMVARRAGIPQSDIPGILMGIDDLFHQEFQHLSDADRGILFQIAKTIPGRPLASLELFDPTAIQKLIHLGLIHRIGNRVDISWHVFRKYLNTGHLPFYDHYLLNAAVEPVVRGLKILRSAKGALDISEFKHQTGLSESVFYDLMKDMDLLWIVKFGHGKVILHHDLSDTGQHMESVLRNHLRNRFGKNRMISGVLKTLRDNHRIKMIDISGYLEASYPFISRTRNAWLKHARILSQWLDTADMALLDHKDKTLVYFDSDSDMRIHDLFLPKRRGGKTPRIQYAPVENIAIRLVRALKENGKVDWTGLHKNTIFRALATLEDLGFILRKTTFIKVLPRAKAFVERPTERSVLFAEGALQLTMFSEFLEILKSKEDKGGTLFELGGELREKLAENWTESTSETIAKVMLDWARQTNLAPGVFAKVRKGPIKGWKKKKEDSQMSLF